LKDFVTSKQKESWLRPLSLVTSNFLLIVRVHQPLTPLRCWISRYSSLKWCSLKTEDLRALMLLNKRPGTQKTEGFAT